MKFRESLPGRRRRSRRSGRGTIRTMSGRILGFMTLPMAIAESFTMVPRWGHASTFLPDPPTLLIQGGKTDSSSSYTYTSSPNSADLIALPLISPFSTSSPPYTLLNSTSTPTYAWHTLSTLTSNDTTASILSFGGDGGPLEATQTQADSAWIYEINQNIGTNEYEHQDTTWGDQPMRRIYHSAATSGLGGKVFITGGLKDDGSGQVFADVYSFDPSISTFLPLPSLPSGLYHHSSLLLPNGTLLVFGGALLSPSTGNPALQPFSSVFTLDTTANSPIWITQTVNGALPSDRRGATVVLNGDGTKAFLCGGGDIGLTEALGDAWILDLASNSWSQISSNTTGGPGPRFDHTAVDVGDGKVIIFGGYAGTGPADARLYIFDTASSTWQTTFDPPSTQPTTTAAPLPGSTAAQVSGSAQTVGPVGTLTIGKPAVSVSDSGNISTDPASKTISPTSSSSPSSSTDHSTGVFTTPVRIGMILGILALAGMAASAMLLAYRRKKRRQRQLGAAGWYPPDSRSGPPARPYGSREKGGEGLIQAESGRKEMWDESPPLSEKPIIGLGMGAIGASLASISSKLGSKRPIPDAYAEIGDEGSTRGGPLRKSTRKVGNGIRLIGPREPSTTSSADRFAPIRMGGGKSRSSLRDSRVDMLGEEDSRRFKPIKEEDWVVPEDESDKGWRSAGSLLGRERGRQPSDDSNPFDEDEVSLYPPIRGGPVPTPRDSRHDLDPFDDFSGGVSSDDQLASGQYVLPAFSPDLATLLPPTAMTRGYSNNSIPRSQRSGQSTTASDAEEGIVRHAQYISTDTPTFISPVETSYEPIRRSASFFQRMAAGGISSLLSRLSTSRPRNSINIRDPAPAPSLWPVLSRDEEAETETPHPPSSFRDPAGSLSALGLPLHGHHKGPSLSSLHSAKSMREMVIIQRETSISTIETEAIIDTTTSAPDPDNSDEGDIGSGGHHRHGVTAITDSPTSTVYAHQRHGMTGNQTPGSIVFNGADFASPVPLPLVPSQDRPSLARNPSLTVPSPTSSHTRPLSPQVTPTKRPASIPEGSPVPTPLLSHRRPVRDVVESINRRGGSVPAPSPNSSLFSPVSQYSPAPGSTRPATMYEAVKRSPLTVANPDGRKGSTNSR